MTPPASTAASCWSSPSSRTTAPAWWARRISRSSINVPAIPASSTKINVPGVITGWSWSNLASVSASVPSSVRSTSAATADGANATTGRPAARHAWTTARMVVVFPAPAGASPSSRNRSERVNARTIPTCSPLNRRVEPAMAWSIRSGSIAGW